MAKRRRLTRFERAASRRAPPRPRVAERANQAALERLLSEVEAARDGGLIIEELPLDAVDADHLIRDRAHLDPAGDAALEGSLRAHGQRLPIEVERLEGDRYGLISGWRRLRALRRLAEEGGGPETVRAIVRPAGAATDAYRAMVQGNELQVPLSPWERARIVARATEAGLFEDEEAAIAVLFAGALSERRSAIRAFLDLDQALGPALRHPARIPERLGLALSQRLHEDPALAARLAGALEQVGTGDPEVERAVLEVAAADPEPSGGVLPPLRLRTEEGRIAIEGPGAGDPHLADDLRRWLAQRTERLD